MFSLYILIIISLLIAAGAFLLYIWAVKTGQFEDLEETKYQVFDEDDDEVPTKPQNGTKTK
ncbi:MAG: cbb3-type cytochrome oxidase assembly protein CcoS [Bacteroidetes bacterium]|nr:cbb3-type cytochrome oxidase assembly protein CcoS [Bacteroidota bacterium]